MLKMELSFDESVQEQFEIKYIYMNRFNIDLKWTNNFCNTIERVYNERKASA